MIWISIIDNASGERDVELLDAAPAESFREGLRSLFDEGLIEGAEIRCGNVNGGDSSVEWSLDDDIRVGE